MRLTTKLLKDIIKEELDNMSEDTSLEEEIEENKDAIVMAAKAVGVPKDLMKMGVELSPAILGGGALATAMKIKDAMKDQEVDDDPRFYDDED
jgi:hypothetical protein